MTPPGHERSRIESWTGSIILLTLLAIAAGVFLQQFNFNPAVLVARGAGQNPAARSFTASQPVADLPPELREFGPLETFTPDNLYDKIDGKAELYLAAGFVQMRCQRFALKASPEQWLEWFVYDMGNLPQAFSVFSTQRRPEGRPLGLTDNAYQTKNAIYFVHGSNYVEAVASSTSGPLMKAMEAMAARFIAATPATGSRLPEFDLLPAQNLVPESYVLQNTDAFGFDQFKNVFTARYRVNDAEVMAFVTSCSNAAAADALRDAYRSFLLANGGKESASAIGGDAGKPIEIMGGVEVVFSKGKFVAGIHAAPSLGVAEPLAAALNERLTPSAK